DILSDARGAKLLLLDTRRKMVSTASTAQLDESSSSYLGFYRYVWLGDDDAPEKARLVYALEQSLSRAPLLGQQEKILAGWARGLGKDALFERSFPPGLRQLRLGKADKQ